MLSRLKFELDELIDEMLSHIPNEMWESKKTTFCDLQMGGGQFIKKIIKKLQEAGHSDKNIKNRIYGYSENDLYLSYVISDKKIIGNFDIYNEETIGNMKFDVIVGNPPYQNVIEGDHKSKKTLWAEFILKSNNILNINGILSLIVPDGWNSPTNDIPENSISIFNDIFKNENLIYCADNSIIKPYFKGIGQSFSMFIFCKNKLYKTTQFRTSTEKFEYNINRLYFIPKKINKISFSIHDKVLNKKNDKFVFERYQKKDGGMLDNRHPHYNNRKLKFSRGLSKFKIDYDEGNCGYDVFTYAYFLNEKEDIQSAISLFNSKLYNLILNQKWNQYFTKYIPNQIPKLPLNKIYTDIDLYKEFNLTQEEINYIENYVG
jgi:hypothetical protein